MICSRGGKKYRYGDILWHFSPQYNIDFPALNIDFFFQIIIHVLDRLWIQHNFRTSALIDVTVQLLRCAAFPVVVSEAVKEADSQKPTWRRNLKCLQTLKQTFGSTLASKWKEGIKKKSWIKKMQFANFVSLPLDIQGTQPTCELT